MKKALIIVACLFGILSIILYCISIIDMGGFQTANIQATIFCAACIVICAINATCAIVIAYLESCDITADSSRSHTMSTSPNKENKQIVLDEQEKQAEIIQKLKEKKPFSTESFLSEIESEHSIVNILNIWDTYKLNIQYPVVETYLKQYKEHEVTEGRLNNISEIKETIKELLGH